MANGKDSYVRLPGGQFVHIPADATPEQLAALRQKLSALRTTPPAREEGLQPPSGPTALRAIPPWYVRAPREAAGTAIESLPMVGGAVGGGLGAAGGPPSQVGLATVLAGGGEALKQLIERGLGWKVAPKTSGEAAQGITEQALLQGIFEMLGIKFGPRSLREGVVAGERIGAKDLYEMSRTPGFRMTASQVRGTTPGILEQVSGLGMWSREAIQGYKRETVEGAEKLATKLLDQIAAKGTPEFYGQFLQDSANTASAAFKREGGAYYQPFRSQFGESIPTTFDPIVQLAEQMEKEKTALLETPVMGKTMLEPLPRQSPAGTLLEVMKNLKGKPQNFKTAMEVRDFLHQYMPGRDQLFADKESEAMAKRFWKKLGDQLSKDAFESDRVNPGQNASPKWEAAKAFWEEGRERFDSTFYKGLMKRNPEFVAKSLAPGNVSDVKLLKSIITDYGTAAEKARGQEAWRSFQRAFAEHRIMNDPSGKEFTLQSLQQMKTRLDKLGGPQLREIYSDPGGQEFLRNARAFAELMSRTDFQGGLAAGKWEVMYDIVGLMGSVGVGAYQKSPEDVAIGIGAVQGIPRFLTAMFHSRPATALFLKTIILGDKIPPRNKTALAMRIVAEAVKGLQRSEEDPYKGVNLEEVPKQ